MLEDFIYSPKLLKLINTLNFKRIYILNAPHFIHYLSSYMSIFLLKLLHKYILNNFTHPMEIK